jgi:hypothetical protein
MVLDKTRINKPIFFLKGKEGVYLVLAMIHCRVTQSHSQNFTSCKHCFSDVSGKYFCFYHKKDMEVCKSNLSMYWIITICNCEVSASHLNIHISYQFTLVTIIPSKIAYTKYFKLIIRLKFFS